MAFIIERTITIKKRNDINYFQERIGILNVMVMEKQDAKQYYHKSVAEAERVLYFGNRPNTKVIFYDSSDKQVAGLVRQKHDSGIF